MWTFLAIVGIIALVVIVFALGVIVGAVLASSANNPPPMDGF